MLTQCVLCGITNTGDSLSAEGECFDCSTGTPVKMDLKTQIRETLDSVAATLARRVGDLKVRVKAALYTAAKDSSGGGFN
jgi:hypothetical protein